MVAFEELWEQAKALWPQRPDLKIRTRREDIMLEIVVYFVDQLFTALEMVRRECLIPKKTRADITMFYPKESSCEDPITTNGLLSILEECGVLAKEDQQNDEG